MALTPTAPTVAPRGASPAPHASRAAVSVHAPLLHYKREPIARAKHAEGTMPVWEGACCKPNCLCSYGDARAHAHCIPPPPSHLNPALYTNVCTFMALHTSVCEPWPTLPQTHEYFREYFFKPAKSLAATTHVLGASPPPLRSPARAEVEAAPVDPSLWDSRCNVRLGLGQYVCMHVCVRWRSLFSPAMQTGVHSHSLVLPPGHTFPGVPQRGQPAAVLLQA
jgi:hypothetical protein